MASIFDDPAASIFDDPAQGAPTPSTTAWPPSPSVGGGEGQGAPSSQRFSDYLLQHLGWGRGIASDQPASFSQGPTTLGQTWDAASDFGRVAANTFGRGDVALAHAKTYGVLPTLFPGLAGQTGDQATSDDYASNLAAEQAKTAAASARLPLEARLAANMVGFMPFGSLGIAKGVGGAITPATSGVIRRWAGGVLGTTAEGAGAGALAGAGQAAPGDVLAGAGRGALGGGVVGALGGAVLSPLARAAAGDLTQQAAVTAAAKAAKEDAYGALKNVPFAGDDVGQAVANARADIEAADPGGALRQNAPRTMSVLARIDQRLNAPGADQTLSGQDAANWLTSQRGTMSPDDYGAAWTQLGKTGQVTLPGQLRSQSAHDIVTSLDNLRDYQGPNAGAENDLAPIVERHLNDLLAKATPTDPSISPGDAATMLANAKGAHQVYKNAQFLQNAQQRLKAFGASPAAEAQDIAERYYQPDLGPGPPTTPSGRAYQAFSDIVKAAGGGSGPSAWNVAHVASAPIEAGAMAALGPAAGALVGPAVTYLGVKPGAAALMKAGQQTATRNALIAAYPALTPGYRVTPPSAAPMLSPAVRALLFGPAAASGF